MNLTERKKWLERIDRALASLKEDVAAHHGQSRGSAAIATGDPSAARLHASPTAQAQVHRSGEGD